jgi:hypothetical protein
MAKKPLEERKQYCSNKEMIAELVKYKETGVMSNELGKMFIDIANKLGGHSFFRYYNNNVKDELISSAIYRLVSNAHKFDLERPNGNAFSYFTQVAWNAFIFGCKKHYKHINLKQKIATEFLTQLEGSELGDCNYLRKQLTEMIENGSDYSSYD